MPHTRQMHIYWTDEVKGYAKARDRGSNLKGYLAIVSVPWRKPLFCRRMFKRAIEAQEYGQQVTLKYIRLKNEQIRQWIENESKWYRKFWRWISGKLRR